MEMEKPKNSDGSFDSLVMNLVSQGWKVKTQLSTTVVMSKTVGVNGWVASILMLLFSLIGLIIVLIWIAAGGTKTLNLQYEGNDYLATVSSKDLVARIRSPHEITPFLTQMQSGFKVGYGAAIGIGVVCIVINVVLSQMMLG
jgi:hypothetical protein